MNHAPRPAPWPRQIAPLTSLRFLAAMAVVLLHFRERAPGAWLREGPLVMHGHLAVDFFFMLSGFVLAHVYMAAVREGRYSHGAFLDRRLARIWPLHLATLGGVLALYGMMLLLGLTPNNPARYDLHLLPANMFMLHAWGFVSEQSFNYPSWSVSAEWFAYLLFPAFAAAALRLWERPLGLLALGWGLFCLLWIVSPAIGGQVLTHWTDGYGIWRILPEFLIGMALWRLGLSTALPRGLVAPAFFGALLLMAGLLAAGAADIWFIPALALLLFATTESARRETAALGWLAARPLVYLGDVSYAIYMVHVLVFTVWFNGIDVLFGADFSARWRAPIWAAALLMVIAAAMIAHHLVELPGKRFFLRLAPFRRLAGAMEQHGRVQGP